MSIIVGIHKSNNLIIIRWVINWIIRIVKCNRIRKWTRRTKRIIKWNTIRIIKSRVIIIKGTIFTNNQPNH